MRRDMWRWKNLELDSMIHFYMKEVGCVGGTWVMSGLFGWLTRHAAVCTIKRKISRRDYPREAHVGKSRHQGMEPALFKDIVSWKQSKPYFFHHALLWNRLHLSHVRYICALNFQEISLSFYC